MAMKEWLAWLPPIRSFIALVLAVGGFSLRLAACHITHSPTLVVDTCHALCRLLALIATIIAYKFDRKDEMRERETRLRNTFGWARIEVVGRLVVHVLFASFGLSLLVSALQLSVHSSHAQPPCDPHPRVTIAVALIGLLVHVVGYLLLAGQELNSGRRLSVTESGGVVLKSGGGRVDVLAHAPADILSAVFVVAAGLTSEWGNPCTRPTNLLRLVDPALSAVASVLLIVFNYPFMREAGLVLLQTVPEGVGTCELRAAALRVPGVLAIHELHVWQLYPRHIVATAHVFYRTQMDFLKSSTMVADVFTRNGISLFTLQPEFADFKDDITTDGGKESDALVSRANEYCGRPCAAHCTAPRCCGPVAHPEPCAHAENSTHACGGNSSSHPTVLTIAEPPTTIAEPPTTIAEPPRTIEEHPRTIEEHPRTTVEAPTTMAPPPPSHVTAPASQVESL